MEEEGSRGGRRAKRRGKGDLLREADVMETEEVRIAKAGRKKSREDVKIRVSKVK